MAKRPLLSDLKADLEKGVKRMDEVLTEYALYQKQRKKREATERAVREAEKRMLGQATAAQSQKQLPAMPMQMPVEEYQRRLQESLQRLPGPYQAAHLQALQNAQIAGRFLRYPNEVLVQVPELRVFEARL